MSDEDVTVQTPSAQPPAAFDFGVRPPTEPSGPGSGAATMALERHQVAPSRSTGVVDWVALVLAILVAPLGILASIVAIVQGIRTNGWASGLAKAALAIGIVLSIALGGVYVLVSNIQAKQAAHDAVIANSAKWCQAIQSTPGTLQSSTFGWPGVADTVTDSIAVMQKYEDRWSAITALAPAGIHEGTQSIATTAKSIIASVSTSRVIDDESNQARISSAVAASGVSAWAAEYCR